MATLKARMLTDVMNNKVFHSIKKSNFQLN